jgi:hypothetical protein
VLLDILRRWLLLVVWVWWRRAPRPFVGAGETVLWRLLVLGMLASHVGTRLLRRWWWERRAHLSGAVVVSGRHVRTLLHGQADLRGRVGGMRRWRAAARSVVASGWGAGLGRPAGEGTWWCGGGKTWLTAV